MTVFTSPENIIFNGIDIAETFNRDGGYFVVQNVTGRSMGDIELITTSVPGRRGSIYRGRDVKHRTIQVAFALKAKSYEDLRKRLEELNSLLLAERDNEIRFLDEMDRTYYGTVENMQEAEEDSRIHKGVITIICTDPVKYAAPTTKSFVDGQVSVQNRGAVTADPVLTFDVGSDITYLDVFTNDDYMRIGRPNEDGLPPIEPKTIIANGLTDSMTGWSPATSTEGSTVAGTMASNGFSLSASSYGTGTSWHGPAYKYGLPAQLQDFEIQARVLAKQPNTKAMGKIVIELLDASDNIVGRMIMYKNKAGSAGNTGAIRVGPATDYAYTVNTPGDNGVAWKQFDGVMRITRRGNRWEGYVAQVDYTTGKHHTRAHGSFVDAANKHTAPVASIRVHFGQLGTAQPLQMNLRGLTVSRLNDVSAKRVPVIAKAGDQIVFDHKDSVVYVNGEPRNDLKDFGANYWRLPKGVTTILAEPSDSITGSITYREGYL